MGAFILSDLTNSKGPNGDNNPDVGEVNGESIKYDAFQNQVGNNNNPNEITELRQEQVWNQFITDLLLKQHAEKAGIQVTSEELTDLFVGDNPHPIVLQALEEISKVLFSLFSKLKQLKMYKVNVNMICYKVL